MSLEVGACLGIPGITAHRAAHVAGPVEDRVVLVQGGAGAVGQCAVALARHAGAKVMATVHSEADVATARGVGAHEVVLTGSTSTEEVVERIRAHAPDGVDHVVEIAFDANVGVDELVLKQGGSIAAYATRVPMAGEIGALPEVARSALLADLRVQLSAYEVAEGLRLPGVVIIATGHVPR